MAAMTNTTDSHYIDSLEALEALGGTVNPLAIRKELGYLHPVYQAMITASPFVVVATVGPDGLDLSPRGDPAGFVAIQDAHTLLLPERRGNNRMDTLRNIVADPRVSVFFLIPGVAETLRVNGRARLSVAPETLGRFVMEGKLPKCVVEVRVETVFFQCGRAIHRSKLWEGLPAGRPEGVPTAGMIAEALTNAEMDAATYDLDLPARQKATLY